MVKVCNRSKDLKGAVDLVMWLTAFCDCRPTQNVMTSTPAPVTNPFGTLPAMPQMTIGRSAGSGPSVQYGISSMPVCFESVVGNFGSINWKNNLNPKL